MTVSASSPQKKGLLIKLVILAVIVAVVVALLLRGVNLRALLNQTLAWIRGVGPTTFFVAMAILPSFGFPLLGFTLPVGPVFSPQLGIPLVIFLVTLSMTCNLLLTYWLARYAFRPFLERLIVRLGYQLPQVAPQDRLSLAVLLRVTPGPPFCLQSYILGLAEVPLRIYMLVSCLITIPQAIALILFGDSLMKGKGKVAFLAFSVIVALSVLIHWVRRRYAQKKLQPA